MTTTTAPQGGHSTPLGLMSCVRESSPQDLVPQTEMDIDRNETSKKRRFHPFRGLRKMFRRGGNGGGGGGKVRNAGSDETVPTTATEGSATTPEDVTSSAKDSHRSRSTSELLAGDEPTRRKSGGGTGMYAGGGTLSVSHDSVFTSEQRSTRGNSTSSDLDLLDTAQSSSSLSIQQLMHQTRVRAELLDVVRRRGRGRGDTSEDEEDLGLPRSPCNSPTTTDKPLKDHPTKSHSTCSDGSLLSMGSSEMDEDSFGQHSRHSSKLSLQDRRPSQASPDSELELGTQSTTAPLSHSAARHKMAVKPKRTHGAPRRRRVQQLTAGSALPTTPEVNEETSARSLTPESSAVRETIAELYTSTSSMNKVWNSTTSTTAITTTASSTTQLTETQLKSASLPPGLALPSGSNKLSRSRSNAGTNKKDTFSEEDEGDDKHIFKEEKKKEESFFGRFLARRSGKKKKSKSEDSEVVVVSSTKSTESFWQTEEKRTYSVDSGFTKVARSGPAARQRILPIDIPSSPECYRHRRQQEIDLDLPMPPPEESLFLDASPPKKILVLPPKTKVISSPSTSPEKMNNFSENLDSTASKPIPVPSPRTIFSSKIIAPELTLMNTSISPKSFSPPKENKEITAAPRNMQLPSSAAIWTESSKSSSSNEMNSLEYNNTKVEETKSATSKVKITGLSSYQQRVMSYNDELDNIGYKSLNSEQLEENNVSLFSLTKSQSFRSKSVISSSQDHASLPFTVNTSLYDTNSDSEAFTDSLMSTNTTPTESVKVIEPDSLNINTQEVDDGNEVKIINTNSEISPTKSEEHFDSLEKPLVDKPTNKVSHETFDDKNNEITISCMNSQVQTKSTNQVIVSISNQSDTTIIDSNTSNKIITTSTESSVKEASQNTQISVTKVQLKRDAKLGENTSNTHVPEFLKIQLNKVDAKPTTNVVLSTSNSFKNEEKPEVLKQKTVLDIETDRENGEVVTDKQNFKFSTEDVEIIDKEQGEEIVEVPSKITVNNVQQSTPKEKKQLSPLNLNNSQPRKSSLVTVSSPVDSKPFLKKKSNSIELGDSIDKTKNSQLNSDKTLANSSDQLNVKTDQKSKNTDDPVPDVILRKKSLVSSQKRDKDSNSDEPELMKVFARRSLKLKDSEVETLSQQVLVLVEGEDINKNIDKETSENSKRDSDKENECNESPEERKKIIFPTKEKEPLLESKYVETADITFRKPVNNKIAAFNGTKYQRPATVPNANELIDSNKTTSDSNKKPETNKKPVVISNYRSHIMSLRDSKDIEIKKSTEISKCTKTGDEIIPLKNDFENEDFVPMFKRIQQRKEEWEQRAQQNMKKSVP